MKRAIFAVLTVALMQGAVRGANEEAAGAYLNGMEAISAGKYAEAEKFLTAAIGLDEENPSYYQARGVARTLAENFGGAAADLQRAAKLAPAKDWETNGWMAIAGKMNGKLDVVFAPGTAPRADVDYAVALSDMGQNYWQSRYKGTYYDKAQKKLVTVNGAYKGDFAKVAAMYVQRHIAGQAGSDKALLARAQERAGAGKNVEALQGVQALLAKSPGDPDLLETKGSILLALGNLEDARRVFTDLLTRRISAGAYIGRAKAAARAGDATRALRDLGKAAALDGAAAGAARKELGAALLALPENPQALWEKLEAQAKAGAGEDRLAETATALVRAMGAIRIRYDERYQDRLAELEESLRARPNDPDCMVALAKYLRDESGVLEERVGPRAEPRPYRAQSAEDLKQDLARAEGLVDAALRDHPDSVAALTVKAQSKVLAGAYEDAEALVNRALALRKDDPDLLEVLASLLQIQAARHVSAAGNLRQLKTWWETRFDEEPPVTYKFTRFPTQEELREAAAEEKRAAKLSKLAEEQLARAAGGAGGTGPTALGWYYRATLQRVRGDSAGAKESMTKAVALKPDFERAWYQLAGICTDLLDGPGAIAARARAYNLAHTTAAAELNSVWFKVPHAQFKGARETIAEGVKLDPADPRLPAYLAVIDEATEKPQEALAHYRMARAISDANLALHGTRFGVAEKEALSISPELAGLPAAIRLRIGALLLDAGKAREAAAEFAAVGTTLAALPAAEVKALPADAILPNPDLKEGMVPLPESIGFLQIRAGGGAAYAQWAAGRSPQDVELAAKTYRRILVAYTMTVENVEALQAISDLGLAELNVHSGDFRAAATAMKSTPAVPQDFWQEMRKTETAVRNQREGP